MIQKLISFILALALYSGIYAIEPVTVVVSLTPPYTPYLNEYGMPGNDKLQVTLIVNDSRMQNYPARLQVFIERIGSGVVMRTSDVIAIPPLMLQGNTTEILQGNDLAYYFMPQNLIFQGMDRNQYIQTNRIPDGQYRIGFRVVDSRRSEVILSNTAYTSPAWFLLNDPPMLNLPRNGNKERVNSSQLLKFEWFPRHLGSMNASFAAKYQLELFAIRIPGMDYKQVAMSSQPVYAEETNSTRLSLDENKYLLEPGVSYAWRVKAFTDASLTVFNNGGYSEIYMFSYGDLCPTPKEVKSDVYGPDNVKISWATDPIQTSYTARYRVTGQSNAVWHTQESFLDNTMLGNLLEPLKTYEYQVMAKCNAGASDYSGILQFTTPLGADKFACGKRDSANMPIRDPKPSLQPGETIYNGKFPIKLTEVSGSNGSFTGKGQLLVPFLNQVKVNMKFDNIKVNTKNQVYEGYVASVYNPNSKFMVSVYIPTAPKVVETDTTHTSNEPTSTNGNISSTGKPIADSTRVAGNTGNAAGTKDSASVAQNATNAAGNDSTSNKGATAATNGGNGTENSNQSGIVDGGNGKNITFEASFEKEEYPFKRWNVSNFNKTILPQLTINSDIKNKEKYSVQIIDTSLKFNGFIQPKYTLNEPKFAYYPGGIGNKTIKINLLDSLQNIIRSGQASVNIIGPNDFTLKAIDKNNIKRIAESSDTLYLVGTNARNTLFKVTSKTNADFDFNNPQWKITYKGNPYGNNSSAIGNTELTQAIDKNIFNLGQCVKANATAYGVSKNVFVKALTGNHKTIDLGGAINVPIAKATSTITKHKEFANRILKVLNKIPGSKFKQRSPSAILAKNRSEIEYDIILKSNKEWYYTEDPTSNLCLKHDEYQFDYGLEVSGEFYLPFPYSFKFPLSKPIVAVGVFAGFEGGVTLRDKVESIKYINSSTELSNKGLEISVIGLIGLKFGVKAEVDLKFSDSFKIELEAMAYANPQVTIEKVIGGDVKIQALVNLTTTASATVKTPIYDFEPAVITYTYTIVCIE